MILDYPVGPSVITGVPVVKEAVVSGVTKGDVMTEVRVRGRFKDMTRWALKQGEGAMSQDMQVASRSWGMQENSFFSCHLQKECSPANLFWIFDPELGENTFLIF